MIRLVLSLVLLGSGQVGTTASPDAVGWWWRVNTTTAAAVPGPPAPVVPEGGFVVANDGVGAQNPPAPPAGDIDYDGFAVAALRFDTALSDSAELTLVAERVLGNDPEVAICPTEDDWEPVSGGPWASRPRSLCAVAATSAVAQDDGVTFRFELPGEFQTDDGIWNLMVMPTSVQPYAVTFTAPGDDALNIAPAPRTAPPIQLPSPVDQQRAPTTDEIVDFLTTGTVPEPTVVYTPEPTAPTRQLAAPVTSRPPVDADEGLGTRALFAALLVGGALLLIRMANTPGHVPAGIGPLKGRSAPVIADEQGGIGRFRGPRSSGPPPLR